MTFQKLLTVEGITLIEPDATVYASEETTTNRNHQNLYKDEAIRSTNEYKYFIPRH